MSTLFKKQIFCDPDSLEPNVVVSASNEDALGNWSKSKAPLAVWYRTFDSEIVARLDKLAFKDLPKTRFVTSPQNAEVMIADALCLIPQHDDVLMGALALDIEGLIDRFARITKSRAVDVRLDAINDDACGLFHIDNTSVRLVTTYIGPGTKWVPNYSAAEAVRQQDLYAGPENEIPRFAVGIFAGAKAGRQALVHRSPRLSGTGRHRLLLCLNSSSA